MYLGLDLGTSGIRALLMDPEQRIIGSASAATPVSRPHPGWSEQDPEDWTGACKEAVAALRAAHPVEFAAVRGIGLSGHMHGATLFDRSDRALRPSILWNDTRASLEAAAMDADPRFRQVTGNIVFPGFTAPKLAWVAKHEPALFDQTAMVLLPKDALRLWLTGEHISEMSDAAGTSWLDCAARDWSDDLLAATGLSRAQMPRLVEGSAPGGQLRADLLADWGLTGPVIVAGGAGDNAASAIGMGTIREGQAFVSLGTSGVIFAANDAFRPLPESAVHAFCHALPDRWHQMGVILSATDALNWYAGITGSAAADLARELGDDLVAPGSASFLPYLSGERTPHNDAKIRGAFTGPRPRIRPQGADPRGDGRRRLRAERQSERTAPGRGPDRARHRSRWRFKLRLLAEGDCDHARHPGRSAGRRRFRRSLRRGAARPDGGHRRKPGKHLHRPRHQSQHRAGRGPHRGL